MTPIKAQNSKDSLRACIATMLQIPIESISECNKDDIYRWLKKHGYAVTEWYRDPTMNTGSWVKCIVDQFYSTKLIAGYYSEPLKAHRVALMVDGKIEFDPTEDLDIPPFDINEVMWVAALIPFDPGFQALKDEYMTLYDEHTALNAKYDNVNNTLLNLVGVDEVYKADGIKIKSELYYQKKRVSYNGAIIPKTFIKDGAVDIDVIEQFVAQSNQALCQTFKDRFLGEKNLESN
jgi:hypothetical protein